MTIHIIQHGKDRLVSGLFWQSLSRPRDLLADATALAGSIDFDLMVLRKDHGTAQAGYANTKDGAQRGMISLAALVAKAVAADGAYYDGRQQPAHNWLGAFKLPDGTWTYFSVRDGNFLPNGDFSGSRGEVLERLHADYGLGGWNVVIGEKELEDQGFHNFNAKSINDFLAKTAIRRHIWSSSVHVLRPVKRRISQKIAWLSVLALVLIGIAAAVYWHQRTLRLEQEALARANARNKLGGKGELKEAPHPWPAKPLPQAMVDVCVIDPDLLAPGGWHLDVYQCTAGKVHYQWSRGTSNVAYLLEQVPQAIVDLNGAKAEYTKLLSLPVGKDEVLPVAKVMLAALVPAFQFIGLAPKITLAPEAPPPPQPIPGMPKLVGTARPVPTWKTYKLVVDTGGVPPVELLDILSQPGIRLEKITYQANDWSIEGVMYAK